MSGTVVGRGNSVRAPVIRAAASDDCGNERVPAVAAQQETELNGWQHIEFAILQQEQEMAGVAQAEGSEEEGERAKSSLKAGTTRKADGTFKHTRVHT